MGQPKKGFTLIEILVVIGIIAVLAAIVLIAINPARQFAQANNAQRTSNANAILNALGQYMVDNKGAHPPQISSLPLYATTTISKAGVDLCAVLTPIYLPTLPMDPTAGSYTDCDTYNTGYGVVLDSNNRITVVATSSQLGVPISVIR
jgi:prepilin-type N-terminal cleavage/methylation domain-containing protein